MFCLLVFWLSGSGCSIYGGEKVYLGVRVRMPVKDLLKNIRLSQGQDTADFQVSYFKLGCQTELTGCGFLQTSL